ncbi:MAG: hypothetical protein AAFR67_12660 [Chloroflexota bacterium]
MLRLFALVMIGVLTACNTVSAPATDVPFHTATPRTLPTVGTAEDNFGGTDIPLDFIGGNPIPLSDEAQFSVAVTGEYIAEINSGIVVYSLMPNVGTAPERNQLYIASTANDATQEITFEFSPTIEAGQYNLLSPDQYVPGIVTASYIRLGFDGTDTRIQTFAENVSGFIQLETVGDTLTGTFQFGAEYTQRSDAGEVDIQSVLVTGRFDDIAYQIRSTDPFEIEVPLPTRNFVEPDETPATQAP